MPEIPGGITSWAKQKLDVLGNRLVSGFQLIALFIIGATIVWSAASDYVRMIGAGRAGLDDILLLFIYLELGTIPLMAALFLD